MRKLSKLNSRTARGEASSIPLILLTSSVAIPKSVCNILKCRYLVSFRFVPETFLRLGRRSAFEASASPTKCLGYVPKMLFRYTLRKGQQKANNFITGIRATLSRLEALPLHYLFGLRLFCSQRLRTHTGLVVGDSRSLTICLKGVTYCFVRSNPAKKGRFPSQRLTRRRVALPLHKTHEPIDFCFGTSNTLICLAIRPTVEAVHDLAFFVD
jgi:hypothetical protein